MTDRPSPRAATGPALLLLLGTVAQCFAVGGRFDLAPAAWLFPVLLLRFTRTGRAWWGGLGVWAANTVAALCWLVESRMGLVPVTVAGAAALSALLALPFLLDRLLAARLRPAAALLLFPAAFAGAEFLITLVSPFGTAYGNLAVTQDGDLPLLQLLPLTGSYGVAFLVGWFAAVANRLLEQRSWRPARRAVAVHLAVLLAVLGAGSVRLAFLPPRAPTVRVAGVSADRAALDGQRAAFALVPGGSRRDLATAPPAELQPAVTAVERSLLDATRREAGAGAKIVVWPEGAVKAQESYAGSVIAHAQEEARRSGVYLEIGIETFGATGPAYGRDMVLLIDPAGAVRWTYDKAHPVPGSESYTPGDGEVPVVDTPYGRLATVICYDADFPALMRVDADIMLVPAHDWREYGLAHTRKAALRAVENGYALFRQDSEGVTAAFDRQGRVLATTDYFTTDRQATVAYLPTRGAPTPYTRIGDTFAWLCLALTLGLSTAALVRPRRPDAEEPSSFRVSSRNRTTSPSPRRGRRGRPSPASTFTEAAP
ncbi:nitrilase-related carbon-nitrogen hydrolase [Kitasatospora cineracea]|uniref:Apolipoprotein N-acyltransferase n=1 Tax=Kitasatospora cineracea TaxID=88074 RepID=A0A3N4R395_9ACTN|nr:nitrilase-related carbon-nitrogen hydrolase [Kitasatospora cineracea]RPE27858.1 apolipoprotein N-acyltransferase [Kitasatospora cineracea]